MFLPIGDTPNDHVLKPYVNWALVALNVLVFLLAKAASGGAAYHAFTMEWGFTPVAPRVETFFTSMFMHADFMHLASNMLFLWIFGDNVESRLGHLGYLLTYLACGLAAVLFFRLLGPDSTVPLVGASGAIFGVTGFYFLAFGRNQVKVLTWFFVVTVFLVPARIVLGVYLALNLFNMLREGGKAGGGVAYGAHVGGFALGLLLAFLLRRAAPAEPAYEPRYWSTRR
jgi:membrane associated rhomboid family serine protease